jgi:hypothetical protein
MSIKPLAGIEGMTQIKELELFQAAGCTEGCPIVPRGIVSVADRVPRLEPGDHHYFCP